MISLERSLVSSGPCFISLESCHASRLELQQCAQSGVTALGHALASGHADCVRALLDCGADASADGIDQAKLERLLAHASNVAPEDALWM